MKPKHPRYICPNQSNCTLKNLLFVALMALSVSMFAQDRVYRKDGKVLRGKVLEVGTSEIKFQYEEETLIYYIDITLVEKILFESGRKETFYEAGLEPGYYAEDRRNALKLSFFSLARNHLTLSYERAIKPGLSFEVDVNAIGLGYDAFDENPAGFGIAGGVKFFTSKRRTNYHMLKGFYIQPRLYFNAYAKDFYGYDPSVGTEFKERKSVQTGALTLNFGYQWVLSNRFLLDLYLGFGYGFTSFNPYDATEPPFFYSESGGYQYGFAIIEDGPPLAGTGGLRIGFLLD
jgi:hypothetical protein